MKLKRLMPGQLKCPRPELPVGTSGHFRSRQRYGGDLQPASTGAVEAWPEAGPAEGSIMELFAMNQSGLLQARSLRFTLRSRTSNFGKSSWMTGRTCQAPSPGPEAWVRGKLTLMGWIV